MMLRQFGTADSSQFGSLQRCRGINVPDATRDRGSFCSEPRDTVVVLVTAYWE